MTDKIHQKVAEVLGMELFDEDDDVPEFDENMLIQPVPEITALVPVPTEVEVIDNPELPMLQQEMIRIEHGQMQTELMLNRGIATVQQTLGEIALMPPVYKARAVESAAELFKAVADLNKYKIDMQMKLIELKMKQAAFTKNKPGASMSPLGTGNTFVFNREDLIKSFDPTRIATVATDEDDDEDDDEDQS
jgi:hypothetical protein